MLYDIATSANAAEELLSLIDDHAYSCMRKRALKPTDPFMGHPPILRDSNRRACSDLIDDITRLFDAVENVAFNCGFDFEEAIACLQDVSRFIFEAFQNGDAPDFPRIGTLLYDAKNSIEYETHDIRSSYEAECRASDEYVLAGVGLYDAV